MSIRQSARRRRDDFQTVEYRTYNRTEKPGILTRISGRAK